MLNLDLLRQQIREANEAYWQRSAPKISDTEYDRLVETLRKFAPNDPLVTKVVGDKLDGQKVPHKEHMYSLGKCYSNQEVFAWLTKISRSEEELIDCQVKMDGMSVELVDGRLISRGDGDIGTDISRMLPYIRVHLDLQHGIAVNATSVIRDPNWSNRRIVGELLQYEKTFDKLKAKYPICSEYKTPRNMVSGISNLQKSQLEQFVNAIGNVCVATLVGHEAYSITVPLKELRTNIDAITAKLRNYKGLPCDGIVFKLHDREYAKTLGYTAHHPIGACALKFKADEAEVVVRNIVWQTGERHVTPVCEFDKVELDGAGVVRATAHSANFFVTNNICVGSTITVIRQGSVIPKIIAVNTPSGLKCQLPDRCPDCHAQLVTEGAFLSCTNPSCCSRIANQIVRGLSILGLKGVGPALARKVVGDLYIEDIMQWVTEMYDWKNDPAKWEAKHIKSQTTYTASEMNTLMKITELMTRGTTASALLKSVCIPEVGDMFTDAIITHVGSIQNLFDIRPVDQMYDALINKPGINLDALTNFMLWVEGNAEDFVDYMKLFNILPEVSKAVATATVKGTVCFTGAGPKPRKELEVDAVKMGYAATDNANVCTILVCADPNGGSSKLKKARTKGIKIVSYEEFFK